MTDTVNTEWLDEIIDNIVELAENVNEKLNKTSGTLYSPPQLINLEARGFNDCLGQTKATIAKIRGEL